MSETRAKPYYSKCGKYDNFTREIVWGEIKKHHAVGRTPLAITSLLQQSGHRLPNGAAMSPRYVTKIIYLLRATNRLAPPVPSRVATPSVLPKWVQGVLTDPELSNDQKVSMLSAGGNLTS